MYFLTDRTLSQNCRAPVALFDWASGRVTRACRSTLAAEILSACSAVEYGDYLKVFLAELRTPKHSLLRAPESMRQMGGILVIDARSFYDFASRETGRLPTDRRLAVDIRLLQEFFTQSKWSLRWVSGSQQLADVLTKEDTSAEYLARVLRD